MLWIMHCKTSYVILFMDNLLLPLSNLLWTSICGLLNDWRLRKQDFEGKNLAWLSYWKKNDNNWNLWKVKTEKTLKSLLELSDNSQSQQAPWYSVSPIYRGRVLRGIGYIAVACWTPFFWRPRARYFSRNHGNSLDPIRGRQFFAKSAHRDSLCSQFAGDNFSRNQLKPTCQCGLEHMLCDGQPR